MADILSPERRSWNMSRIKNKDTGIEEKVRKSLFKRGFRYRKNVGEMPGKPDVVLRKYHTVVFIHGCFWHRHENCKDATVPKTRTVFWLDKFEKNVANDRKHRAMLENDGWQVITLWECDINRHFEETMELLVARLQYCKGIHADK